MTMDKYSQDDDSLLEGLRNEEAQLMQQIQNFMSLGEKTASEEAQMRTVETRLHAVRGKITDMDLARAKNSRG